MHFRYILLAIISHFSIASALCYTSGRLGSYRKNQDVLDLRDVCHQLSGTFKRLEVQRVCVTDKIDVSWSFELKMIGWGETRDIDIEECMDGMKKELSCRPDRGGVRSYWNWRYKVKPNERDQCFKPPFWKRLGAYDAQDEPKWYNCHNSWNLLRSCWKDEWSLPGYEHTVRGWLVSK
ncbi:hypothetical protein LY78DRAFT_644437 [Colletotrichum sublineola]|nr:hypothetical protein LY78DRAFT_644437 [Colletotrichum sublineola]